MNQKLNLKFVISGILWLAFLSLNAQNPDRFREQVQNLTNRVYSFDANKKLVVFTGSSSIVRWKNIQSVFPEYNVVNNGFGGSEFSDLLYFYDDLILKQKPDILFVYEGDNDIARGKTPDEIFVQAKALIAKIKTDLPQTRVILISPKPSLANWDKKGEYKMLNKKLAGFCERTEHLEFADVWKIMVDENGVVYPDIFVEDGDHMNEKGYNLWVKVVGGFL